MTGQLATPKAKCPVLRKTYQFHGLSSVFQLDRAAKCPRLAQPYAWAYWQKHGETAEKSGKRSKMVGWQGACIYVLVKGTRCIMYTTKNFLNKRAIKEAIKAGEKVTVYEPGIGAGSEPKNGTVTLEGPHFPKPHTWYGQGVLKDGVLVSIK